MSDTITNRDTGRWLKLIADWEHDPDPLTIEVPAPTPRIDVIVERTPMKRPYEDVARERRVYESGGFGGAYSPPSGALEP